MKITRKETRARVHRRIRKKLAGTSERPRLAVYFSNKNIYAQLIDDTVGRTLAFASTLDKEVGHRGKLNLASAQKIGQIIAERGKAAKISSVVFDRGGFLYHGKVQALADAARQAGLQF